MTDILALDIATTTGWCRGVVGGTPSCGTVCFGRNCSANAVFAQAIAWFSNLLKEEPQPDALVIEAMLPGGAMRGETTIEVRDRLAGLHAIARGVAHIRGIHEISTVDVGAVRQHFIGARNLKSDVAKREVVAKCRAMGWPVEDNNAADAVAVWSFACALIEPETALRLSPLFMRRAAE